MAYNKRNKLERIVEIQNTVLEHKRRGATQLWVYQNIIYPQYRISYSCYNQYLAINAKRELERLNNAKRAELSLF